MVGRERGDGDVEVNGSVFQVKHRVQGIALEFKQEAGVLLQPLGNV